MAIKRALVILISLGFIAGIYFPVSAKKTELTEHDYIIGEPDRKREFPIEAFKKAKELKNEKNLKEAESVLLENLEAARIAGKGTTRLGKYLLRLNNVLFALGKDEKAIKYGDIGVKLIAKDYKDAGELSGWLVNGQSHLAMSFQRQGKLKEALKMFNAAIETANQAPEGKVSSVWLEFLKGEQEKLDSKLNGNKTKK